MKKLVLVSIGCLFAVAGVAAAQGHGRCGGPGMRGALLEKADANHDGKITRDELFANERAMFGDADANHDGKVTPDELRAAFDRKKSEHFASKDKNGDGKLSADELPRMPSGMFGKLDANHDGSLSRDELANFGPGHGHDFFFKMIDTNADGVITQDEADAAADERFERMDKNGDKVIDQSELGQGGWHGGHGPAQK